MKLHALIIGINAYDRAVKIENQYAFPPLQGCVGDAVALHQWLQQDTSFELHAKVLLDKDATKQKIVEAFRNDLSKAEPGDAILIFYSGHGTVEYADAAVWREETDGRLEGLACYYEQGDTGKFILADKELRYLLKSISKPDVHIVALFDCCHSGDNTRAANAEPVRKQGLIVFQQRQWGDFVFAEKYKREEFIWNNTDTLLPEGAYVQLAASESNEAAIESWINRERHGVFAWYLLEILRETGGHISYRDLCNRMRNRIQYKYDQRIKIYAPKGLSTLEDSGFLKKEVPNAGTGFGTVDYNAENNEYRINRGILDRVASGKTKVTVAESEGAVYTGVIGRAELNVAEVIFDGTILSRLSKKAMQATLEGLASRPVRIFLCNKELHDAAAIALAEKLFSIENEAFVQQESVESRADYTLLCWAGMYYFAKPGDWYRPVAMPVFMENENAVEALEVQLKHLAQWHFTLDLRNDSSSKISTDLLQVEIFDKNDTPIAIQNGMAVAPLSQQGKLSNGTPVFSAGLKVKVTNNSQQDLYVQPVFMTDYGCMVSLVTNPDGSRAIEPGDSETMEIAIGQQKLNLLPIGLDDSTRLFNLPYASSTLKFIISSAPINGASSLDLASLPMPNLLVNVKTRGDKKGAFNLDPVSQTLPEEGWNAVNIEVRCPNPLFDKPNWNELTPLMAPEIGNPYLAHFFTGLYLESQGGPAANLRVRTEEEGLEKGSSFFGIVMAGANYWANYRRNSRFDKMSHEYPQLPVMVSEGDSWFQHPLLDDIIDNIANIYPTYCLAAAGDTIRKYYADGDYVDAVRKKQPKILILSGGGNDILGEEMPNFLQQFTDGPAEGEQPGRFFNATFKAELDDIANIYRNIFDHFKTERPGMPILVHSYDYPRPRPTNSGPKRNWLGQYFDGKGILREGDRHAAVRYMLDEFSSRLMAVAAEFPDQVHFLDLRGMVRDTQWDDEIHPDNSGFQNVAGIFIRKINSLVAAKP